MPHYASYRTALKTRFGKPVVKIPVNGGFSCPNRDGVKSGAGCFFCDNRSFSPVALQKTLPPVEQLLQTIRRTKTAGRLLLPYLQPFSNTYGPPELLEKIYEPLLAVPGVIGLAVGTRPDCFTEDTYRYLAAVARRSYLNIELGLQSAHEETLIKCNRGHTFGDFKAAAQRLAADGIETVAHVMLGLPGESRDMMLQTARELAGLPCTGVKIHQLMIIEGTVFAQWYRRGDLQVLSLDHYTELLCGFLACLRPDQQVHRIVADATVENGLVAPLWSADKMGTLRHIHRFMDEQDIRQGSAYR
jgi:hypothetical protein